jgi:hypothetical protein
VTEQRVKEIVEGYGYAKKSDITWSNLSGKPSKFPAESHDHTGTGHSHTVTVGSSTYTTSTKYLVLSGP